MGTGAGARRRWTTVLGLIAALCSVPVLLGLLPANAERVDPAALRARILAADPPHSGYAESVGSLGLPDLPAVDDLGGLLGGRTRMRVWHSNAAAWRVDVLTGAGESGQYATASGTTAWDFEENLRTDLVGFPALRLPRPADLLPPALAQRLLKAAGAGAHLESLPARRIAGVSAPGVRARPTDPDTTVGAVDVWADPRSGLPLEVEVVGKAAGPADLRSRFLELDQGPVAPERLAPPAADEAEYVVADAPEVGTALDERLPDTLPNRLVGRAAQNRTDDAPRALRVYGSGLAAFTALTLPPGLDRRIFRAARAGGAVVAPLTTGNTKPIPGMDTAPQIALIRTTLITLLILVDTADGFAYMFAGPVREKVLLDAAREVAAREVAP
ncbi:MAG: hypothetical protein ACT4QG_11330 [Sporichthyaceae bacterium]